MFGPTEFNNIHHRDKEYSNLYQQTEKLFKSKFDLNDEIVLFINGSGTHANEIVISSLIKPITPINLRVKEKFGIMLKDLAIRYNKYKLRQTRKCMVQYETSASKINPLNDLGKPHFAFVDSVSAFPYFDPYNVDLWTTVAFKQLLGPSGLSIIVLKPKCLKWFKKDNNPSVLNLYNYIEYYNKYQTPHTPSIENLFRLNQILEYFDIEFLRNTIDYRRSILEEVVPEEVTIGNGPVFTFAKNRLTNKFISKWSLYNNSENIGPQLFLWTGTNEQYEEFCLDLYNNRNDFK